MSLSLKFTNSKLEANECKFRIINKKTIDIVLKYKFEAKHELSNYIHYILNAYSNFKNSKVVILFEEKWLRDTHQDRIAKGIQNGVLNLLHLVIQQLQIQY